MSLLPERAQFVTGDQLSIGDRPAWLRYGIAVGAVLLGWLTREALTPVVGQERLPFIFFFPAVALSAWYGGLGSAVLATALSTIAADWAFIGPAGTLGTSGVYNIAAIVSFLLACVFIIGAIELMHRAQRRLLAEMAERASAQRMLRQEKELLTTTLSSIGDAVVATDLDGRITFINPEAERLTGWRSMEASGQPLLAVFRIINEQTRQPVENPVDKVIRTGTVIGLANHTVLISKTGREIPIDDSAAPIRRTDGSVSGVILVFRDFSERQAAQRASARLAAIVEHSGDAILTKDLNGVVQSWNTAAERLFGYAPHEIIGKPVTLLFPPDRLTEEDQILSRLREGRTVERLETIRVSKDGRTIPVEVSISPIKDPEGQIIGASKIIRDVSDLVAAREALVEEKELLATTLASIGDAVVLADARGRVTFLNAEAERLTGWKTDKAAGHPLPEVFRIVNEQSREPVEDPVAKVMHLGKVVGLANHTILIGKDGGETPIDDSAAPIRREGGSLLGVVLVFRDASQQRRDEEHLAHLVRERTAKLREMMDELQHVSYAITHDMRAPLRAMSTFAGIILSELSASGQPSQELLDACRRIIASAGRLDQLIQDALNYTKAVLQELPLHPVDLARLIPSLIESYPNLQADKADILIADPLPVVLGEESLLTQCFSNLLGNAVKFVTPGTRPRVVLHVAQSDGIARISVLDNGIGIPREAQRRLFGMFERLTSGYEGTGIGLAIVRKVVERMGGKVGAASEPGQGSEFWVELRLAPAGTYSSAPFAHEHS